MSETTGTSPAASIDNPPPNKDLEMAMRVIAVCAVVDIELAMGCVTDWREVIVHVRRPVEISIGLACQFLFNPIIAFVMASVLSLSNLDALCLLIIGSCPGGAISNVLTYFVQGDVALSITMTTVSTVVAIVMMPLNLWLYSRRWTDAKAVIPYVKIVVGLVCIAMPAAVGMVLLNKAPKVAKWIGRIGSTLGLLLILTIAVLSAVQNPSIVIFSSWKVWFAALTFPLFGNITGYVVTLLFRRPHKICRTVAIETSVQNVALVFSLIYLSFPRATAIAMSRLAMIFSAFFPLVGTTPWIPFAIFFKRREIIRGKRNADVSVQREETAPMTP